MVLNDRIPAAWQHLSQIKKRIELLELLHELSDIETQERLWLKHEDFPNSSGIDEIFHFFFDDTDLVSNPKSLVGIVLLDDREVKEIEQLTSALSGMLSRLGDVDSQAYMSDPEWASIVSLAQSSLRLFESSAHR